jgi:hypothetical protein
MPAKPVQHRLLFPKRPGRPRKDPFDRRGHHGRPELDPRVPLLITQKFVAGSPYARTMEHLVVFEDVLLRKQDPEGFRVVEYSLQGNHYHLIVEVPGGREGLARALRSFHGALTKSWNRLSGRQGGMFASYDEAPLGHARRAANAVRYVLWNAYHHRVAGSAPDRASSARWSGAWTTPMSPSGARLAPVFPGETYILREAMRRFPLQRCRPPRGLRVDGVG